MDSRQFPTDSRGFPTIFFLSISSINVRKNGQLGRSSSFRTHGRALAIPLGNPLEDPELGQSTRHSLSGGNQRKPEFALP